MSDLSVPREAAEWAASWLTHPLNALPLSLVADPEHLEYRRQRCLDRIERAVRRLHAPPAQRERCADSIKLLVAVLAREGRIVDLT